MKIKKALLFSILFSTLWSFATSAPTVAQSRQPDSAAQTDDRQVLRALLDEVRKLRHTIERNNLNTFRAQLIFERIRLHRERYDHLATQIEDVRDQLTDIKGEEQRFSEDVKELESQMSQERDRSEYARFEADYKTTKSYLEQLKKSEAEQSERENALNAQLQTERSKLDALNAQLDALEREIEAQQSTDEFNSTRKP